MEIIDSGERREFDSGAVRDIQEGKGRCDLLPLGTIGARLGDQVLQSIDEFVRKGHLIALWSAFNLVARQAYPCMETALLELSRHYEDGCLKYGERNWEKGIPVHCYIDSAVRHWLKYKRGDTDEHHDRAVLWNIIGAMWTMQNRPEMNDIEFQGKD